MTPSSSDTKRGHMGFPVLHSPTGDPGASPSEPPPPSYEDATSSVGDHNERGYSPHHAEIKSESSHYTNDLESYAKSSLAVQHHVSSYASGRPLDSARASVSETIMHWTPTPASSNLLSSSTIYGVHTLDNGSSSTLASSAPSSTINASTSCSRNSTQSSQRADTSGRRAQQSPPAPFKFPGPFIERAPPPGLAYDPFPPAVLYARSLNLMADGFPREPPTCARASRPHPFVTHDVSEDDWVRFLEDVQGAGGLTPVNSIVADAAPVAVMTGFIGGYIAKRALEAHVNNKRKSAVADVIDRWNRMFFHPRLMNVVLAQGVMTYTGAANAPPADMAWRTGGSNTDNNHVRAYEDDDRWEDERWSTSSRSSVMGRRGGRSELDGHRFGGEMRQNRRGRVQFSRDLKSSAGERWRLVVSYQAPVM